MLQYSTRLREQDVLLRKLGFDSDLGDPAWKSMKEVSQEIEIHQSRLIIERI